MKIKKLINIKTYKRVKELIEIQVKEYKYKEASKLHKAINKTLLEENLEPITIYEFNPIIKQYPEFLALKNNQIIYTGEAIHPDKYMYRLRTLVKEGKYTFKEVNQAKQMNLILFAPKPIEFNLSNPDTLFKKKSSPKSIPSNIDNSRSIESLQKRSTFNEISLQKEFELPLDIPIQSRLNYLQANNWNGDKPQSKTLEEGIEIMAQGKQPHALNAPVTEWLTTYLDKNPGLKPGEYLEPIKKAFAKDLKKEGAPAEATILLWVKKTMGYKPKPRASKAAKKLTPDEIKALIVDMLSPLDSFDAEAIVSELGEALKEKNKEAKAAKRAALLAELAKLED